MERKFFNDCEELCDYMFKRVTDGFYVVAVLFYQDAIDLIEKIIIKNKTKIEALDIAPKDYDGYDKEYYISIATDFVLSVEPAFAHGKYLDAEADLTLIDGNASSSIINTCEKKYYEIYIGDSIFY